MPGGHSQRASLLGRVVPKTGGNSRQRFKNGCELVGEKYPTPTGRKPCAAIVFHGSRNSRLERYGQTKAATI